MLKSCYNNDLHIPTETFQDLLSEPLITTLLRALITPSVRSPLISPRDMKISESNQHIRRMMKIGEPISTQDQGDYMDPEVKVKPQGQMKILAPVSLMDLRI